MKRRQCSAIFVGNIRRQTRLHGQKSVQILAPQLCSNSFLQPLMFGLESTEELVHVRLPVIKKEKSPHTELEYALALCPSQTE